jgi:hypothetical protein
MFSLHPCAVGGRDVRRKQVSHSVESYVVQPTTFLVNFLPLSCRAQEGQEERFRVSLSGWGGLVYPES